MVNQKFSKLTGPQTKVMANLDEEVPDLATDKVPFLQEGVAKKVDIADLVDGMTGIVTATGLDNADGVLSVDIAGLDPKTEPVAADSVAICDSEATNALKEATLTNLAKPLAGVMAGVADTTGLSDTAGVLTVAAKIAHLEAALLKGRTTVPMSFESGEQTTTKIYFPMKVTINKIRGIVMKAVADTNNGTITCGNSAGDSANGVITAIASAVLNTEYLVSPTTNNIVLADEHYYLTSAKANPGGKVLVSLEWTITA